MLTRHVAAPSRRERRPRPINTRQREIIWQIFLREGRPLSPAEILTLSKACQNSLSIATVYRNLRLLVAEGWLDVVPVCGGIPRYEPSGKQHHHHFQCDDCGRLFDVPGCWLPEDLKLPQGFEMTGHDLVVRGLCSDCANKYIPSCNT